VVRATAITPGPVAGRAGHGIHRVAEHARLVRKEWADYADLPQDARAQMIPIWRGATYRADQPTGELSPSYWIAETLARVEVSTWPDAGDLDLLTDIPGKNGDRRRYEGLAPRSLRIESEGVPSVWQVSPT
jgi:hypothetical protein